MTLNRTFSAIIILSSFLLVSCSMPSGRYVNVKGKWVFKNEKIGYQRFLNQGTPGTFDGSHSGEFLWPVPSSFKITSNFGPRSSKHHDGIDVGAPRGSAIVSSSDGKVVFSGRMSGYGKTVVVAHGNGFHTVYAHAQNLLVSKGQRVAQGEVIAKVGSSGRSTGPHLHFEIRKDNRVHNPAWYLSRAKKSLLAGKR